MENAAAVVFGPKIVNNAQITKVSRLVMSQLDVNVIIKLAMSKLK